LICLRHEAPHGLRLSRIPSICALIPHTDFGVCPGEIRLKPPVAFEDKVQKMPVSVEANRKGTLNGTA
ncbi:MULTISPECIES: hypothetical protein, partial [Mesorhizobium]|uniref:hypothetical protein n=1 Tax=Mesorhizobium TaxID=68287 RepID=UPI00197DB168